MNPIYCQQKNSPADIPDKPNCKTAVRLGVFAVALACSGSAALGQTNAPPAAATADSASATNVTTLPDVTVIGQQLNQDRSQILTSVGATAYQINEQQIQNISQGANAPFDELILRAPGVAEDSAANGDLHVRGEHANLQYRINDVLLPEGISGFGLELDPRFVQSMQLITGSLPAEYGFRTAGVVDIQTKSGFENGGEGEIFGGSHDTIRPSFELGGTQDKLSYFVNGSFEHNSLGIENVTPAHEAIHDDTDQYKGFAYLSYILDDTSRLSFIGSSSYATYQIPVDPGLQPVSTQGNGNPWEPGIFTPTDLNDSQIEQNYYGVLAYQKAAGDLNLQAAVFGRDSSAHYTPYDTDATLFYNGGVATDENRRLDSGGVQADASYQLGDHHTIRGGLTGIDEFVFVNTTTTVFPVDGVGDINGPAEPIMQGHVPNAIFAGVYLQDEWKILPRVTVNYGARFDVYDSSFDHENQLSPRVNIVYDLTARTTLHAGYSRYFTPPPLETVPASDLAVFGPTSGAVAVTTADSVKAERANYFDAGVSQVIVPGLRVGLDGYYKTAENQLDDGLFGQSLILSSFNYQDGRVRGAEISATYETNGISLYANVAYSIAQGKGASSAQFLWADQATVDYVNGHWINLDHDQRVSGSFGAAYSWSESPKWSARVYCDALYGSGLRQDGDGTFGPAGEDIPNGEPVGGYYTVNLGAEQSFKLSKTQAIKARLDVVNITDNAYQLRTGSGVGVNDAQYGARLGVFGSLSYAF
jgi:outer membrane receptor protein involved in Fe transport